ncbi:MAG: hypothetical protein ACOYB3_01815 [Azonexus sp.]
MIPEPEMMSSLIHAAITSYDSKRPRSVQSNEGILGPSDLGFCQQKALLTLKGTPRSDSKSIWPAVIGTAVGAYVEQSIKDTFPDWLVGAVDGIRVTYTMKNGATISGTPDVIIPSMNCVVDLKTKDGFEWEQRNGSSRNHKFQRHAYVRGAVEAGILDGTKPLYVGNVFLDRSGGVEMPFVEIELVDDMLDDEIAAWVDDVMYARVNNEDASRDVAPSICARICEFYTVCRGGLPMRDSDVYTDPEIVTAANMYVEGREMATQGEKQRKAAGKVLAGLNGVADGWQIRTTDVDATDVPGFFRRGYTKVEVVPVKVPKS